MRSAGAIIKDARRSRGISQEGLADSLHVSRAYLSMVESGARPITEETALRLADLLGVDRLVLLVAAVSGSRWPVLGKMLRREMGDRPEMMSQAPRAGDLVDATD